MSEETKAFIDSLRLTLDKLDLSLGTPVDYSVPQRQFVFFNVLSDKPILLHNYINHVFWGDIVRSENGWDNIIHGHSMTEVCSTPAFCHVYGYRPKSTDNPKFIRLFNAKWGEFYD